MTTSLYVEHSSKTAKTPVLDSEAAKAFIVSEGARLCAAAAGQGTRAIVLTGSMSRGEATLKRDDAAWRVLGDATFLLVSDEPVRLHVPKLQREIEVNLSAAGITCKVVVVTSTTGQLRAMKPQIYAYELRERGIVLRGDQDMLRAIPQFRAADIPQEDGWWLLCNRMIEQLEAAATQTNSLHESHTAVRYRIAKLYLAMAACYLLAVGEYLPSYRERAARLEELAAPQNRPPAPVPLQRLAKFVSQCTDLKLRGEALGDPADFPQWRDAISDAEALWRWALARIVSANGSASRTELLAALAAQQPILARAKGWVRAAYVSPMAVSRNWQRWARLGFSMSPRYLVYGAASELFFAAPTPDAFTRNELADIVARLPLAAIPADQQLSWRAAAILVAHNFHVFLESTRS
jgi:hypothetical protein